MVASPTGPGWDALRSSRREPHPPEGRCEHCGDRYTKDYQHQKYCPLHRKIDLRVRTIHSLHTGFRVTSGPKGGTPGRDNGFREEWEDE